MTEVTMVAVDGDARLELDPELLTAWLTGTSAPADRPEHITVRRTPGRVELVFFHAMESPCAASSAAAEICRRAMEAARQLGGWGLAPEL
ncbi:hypothetical protein OG304_14360 [Streptomyces sp. NBC_00160]|uniref:hypothetical protein n=1 Tax=Streptomyces sp. NBC_00160 TaxID=2903628 RepID=UPI00224E0910|nr:hypothetical protein [Streptomyces sp. NBC_00160]MCX5304637.1 hypothetical protein [Streptomyces sp. NBC_00160]